MKAVGDPTGPPSPRTGIRLVGWWCGFFLLVANAPLAAWVWWRVRRRAD